LKERIMSFPREAATAIKLGLMSLPVRLGASLVVVIGMACAVGAMVSVLSLSTGFIRTATGAGRADRAIVLSQGALAEGGSSISRDGAAAIVDAPGVAKAPDGRPLVSADMLGSVMLRKEVDGFNSFVTVRGVGPEFFALHPEIHMTHGRKFQPGTYEVIVGNGAQAAFTGLAEGSQVDLPQGRWVVTGSFKSKDGAGESQLLTDAPTLMSAMRAMNFKSVTVGLTSPKAFAAFKKALTTNPALSVQAIPEPEYLASQARSLNAVLLLLGYVVGGIMGLGAMFGALNTMYSAVSARRIEIATLRAIGFGGVPVALSVLVESLFLALAGACIGVLIAWAAFNNHMHVMAAMVIHLAVTPGLALGGITFAAILAAVGGIFPAVRASSMPIAEALRAT
jgi:putative ABC transport system permease protein